MAYMAKQFLKRSMRLPGNTPVQVVVTDNRDIDNLEFIMTLNRVDVKYFQEVEFNQAEAESLLEGLLFKIAKNINPETKVKLMGLLSASKET
jgi:hypothetical protein